MSDQNITPSSPSATSWEDQWSPEAGKGGGNLSGHDPSVQVFMVPSFQGMSGQPNNQSTDRPMGSS